MTLYRPPGTVESELLLVINDLSPADIETFTGKSVSHFYKVANPAHVTGLHLTDAAMLDAALRLAGKRARLVEFMLQVTEGEIARRGGVQQRAFDLNAGLRHVSVEVGDLHRVADKAMEDGVLKEHERREIARQAQNVADEALEIRDSLEPPAALQVAK